MTTTPEQLQAWREEFEKTETNPYLEKTALGMYAVTSIENRWQGYLRRCQETEQAIKDARKQALADVAEGFVKQKSWVRDYAYGVVEHAAEEGATK